MASLILVRHGESEWNAKSLWTGWTDIALSEKGHEEARSAGEKLGDIHFDIAFTSDLTRAHQTLDEILNVLTLTDLPTNKNSALKERNYGDYTGKNKWEIQKEVGEEKFTRIHRGWDEPIPNGETLKDVYERVIPYYQKEILPELKLGKNVIVSAHGNSLRALVKYLENISDKDIENLEIPTGEVLVYQVDQQGKTASKEIR